MRKLEGIIKGFNKVVIKLDNLVVANHLIAAALNSEIVDKQARIKSLDYEADKADSISRKIADLIS